MNTKKSCTYLHCTSYNSFLCTNITRNSRTCASFVHPMHTRSRHLRIFCIAAFSSMQNNVAAMHNCTLAIAKLPEQCVRPPFFLGARQIGRSSIGPWIVVDTCDTCDHYTYKLELRKAWYACWFIS